MKFEHRLQNMMFVDGAWENLKRETVDRKHLCSKRLDIEIKYGEVCTYLCDDHAPM